jgi:hypothetical protein
MKLALLRSIGIGAGVALLMLALTVAAPRGLAQDATPMTELTMGDGGVPHPAHIHAGSCATLDPNPLFPLADVVIPAAEAGADDGMADDATPIDDATPMASPMASPAAGGATGTGSASAMPAGQSTTVVTTALSDLLAAEHAINVHLSYDDVSTYIACGAIGGTADANGNLFVGLAEQNASGYSGIVWLHDNGDGTTTVTIFLSLGLHEGDAGEAATPAA